MSSAKEAKAQQPPSEIQELGQKRPFLQRVTPIKPMPLKEVPRDLSNWRVELKYNGVRALTYLNRRGTRRLETEGGQNITINFPEFDGIFRDILKNHRSIILDGEIVSVFHHGSNKGRLGVSSRANMTSKEKILQGSIRDPAVFVAFDVLYLDGRDLRFVFFDRRKEILRSVLPDQFCQDHEFIDVSDAYGDIRTVLDFAQRQNFEGIILKRADSSYLQRRNWLKFRFPQVEEEHSQE